MKELILFYLRRDRRSEIMMFLVSLCIATFLTTAFGLNSEPSTMEELRRYSEGEISKSTVRYVTNMSLITLIILAIFCLRCVTLFDVFKMYPQNMMLAASLKEKFLSRLLFSVPLWFCSSMLSIIVSDYLMTPLSTFVYKGEWESGIYLHYLAYIGWDGILKNVRLLVWITSLFIMLGCWFFSGYVYVGVGLGTCFFNGFLASNFHESSRLIEACGQISDWIILAVELTICVLCLWGAWHWFCSYRVNPNYATLKKKH